MGEVLTQEGKGYLVHPWTGEVQEVPEAEVSQALAAGLQPASAEQARGFKVKEHYSGAGMGALATLAGAARGVSFGLSDPLLSPVVHPETLRQLEEAHPYKSGIGEATGTVGSFLIPFVGVGGQVAKVGARAGMGVAKLATRALPGKAGQWTARVAAPVVREAVTGAAIGAGGAVSDVTLEQLDPEQARARLLTGLAHGAAFGAGLGVLAFGGGMAGQSLRKRFDPGLGEIRKLRGQRKQVTSEMDTLKASVPQGTAPPPAIAARLEALEGSLGDISTNLAAAQSKVIGAVATRAVASGLAIGLGGGVTGGVLATLVAPKALSVLKKALGQSLERASGKVAGRLASGAGKATPWVSRVKEAWGVIRGTPVVGEAAEAAAQAGLRRGAVAAERVGAEAVRRAGQVAAKIGPRAEAAVESLGHGAGEAVGAVALHGGADAALGGFVGGGITGLGVAVGAHAAKHQVQRLGDLALRKIVPAARVSALDRLTAVEWEQVAEELPHMETGGLEALITMQSPDGLPEQLRQSMAQQVLRSVGYLQEQAPRAEPEAIPSGAPPRPTGQQRREYLDKVKAVFRPDSLLESFAAQNTPAIAAGVAAWQAVHPQALAQLREVIGAEVQQAAAAGHRYDRRTAHSIALIQGVKGPGMYDAQRVAQLQALYQNQQGPKASGSADLGQGHATTLQRVQGVAG